MSTRRISAFLGLVGLLASSSCGTKDPSRGDAVDVDECECGDAQNRYTSCDSDNQCVLGECRAGYLDCDEEPGCEVESNGENCGSCGRSCQPEGSENVVSAFCQPSAACTLECAEGYSDDDQDPSNGCEGFSWEASGPTSCPVKIPVDGAACGVADCYFTQAFTGCTVRAECVGGDILSSTWSVGSISCPGPGSAGIECHEQHRPCGDDLQCVESVCVGGVGTTCFDETGCVEGLVCVEEMCAVHVPGSCTDDDDCEGEATCVSGMCKEPGTCAGDFECSGTQVCVQEVCKRRGGDGDACEVDSHCAGKRLCIEEECVSYCLYLSCGSDRGQLCGTPCLDGQGCDADEDCSSGHCDVGGTNECEAI